MKPTPQQDILLKKYLNKILSYRETYTECYDHILSALETKPDDVSFQDTIDDIIAEDFGGIKGLLAIESRYKALVRGEMKRKYRQYFTECLKIPLIGRTLIIALLFYATAAQPWFNYLVFIEILLCIRLIPGIYKWVRHFRLGYIYKSTKRSVRDNVYGWLDYIPAYALGAVVAWGPTSLKEPWGWFKDINPAFIAVILVLTTLHTFTYYKLYREEIKMIMMTWD